MDGERWRDWMKSMYGLGIGEDVERLEDVKVVVASHKDLVYYDQDPSGQPFSLASPSRLYTSLSSITTGTLGYKHSENAIERLARHLNTKITSFEEYVVEHPLKFVGVLNFIGLACSVTMLMFPATFFSLICAKCFDLPLRPISLTDSFNYERQARSSPLVYSTGYKTIAARVTLPLTKSGSAQVGARNWLRTLEFCPLQYPWCLNNRPCVEH
ncbi:hypothetical protein BKA70DRAFT_1572519 [Coprinopsis sp. MPI-PUGE-AT-0042]|nr:hypothetical protein BKA70DRAFT_1572519 [Coprinopsis sp. MPI-PUGE-AT-0042]